VIHGEEWPQGTGPAAAVSRQATATGTATVLNFGKPVVLVDGNVVLGAKVPIAAHPEAVRLVLVLVPPLLAVGVPAWLAVLVKAVRHPSVLVEFAARFGNSALRTVFHMRILASS
jgi:hypothetical protein